MAEDLPGQAYICPATLAHHGVVSKFLLDYFPRLDQAFWAHHWQDNPFSRTEEDHHTGWILVNRENQSVVGFLGRIFLEYEWNRRRIRAAAMTSVAVDSAYRRYSLQLFAQFFQQQDVELFLNTTANQTVGRVMVAFGAQPVPRSEYDRPFTWIINRRRCLRAILAGRGVPLPSFFQYPGAMLLKGREMLIRRKFPLGVHHNVCQMSQWDERFDNLWAMVRQRSDRLQAVRSRSALQWHFSMLKRSGKLVVLGIEVDGRLDGYIAMVRRDLPESDLRRVVIADLQVRDERVELVSSLLAAALEWAHRSSIDVVEAMGFNDFKQDAMRQFAPMRRTFPVWPFYYKARDIALSVHLDSAVAWDPCFFDGDASFY